MALFTEGYAVSQLLMKRVVPSPVSRWQHQ